MMVVCVHIPRFELTVAAGGRAQAGRQALAGLPLAIAPAPGGHSKHVGEVSGAAEAHGVHAGMALSEALARCPSLRLLPADPLGVADAWEAVLAGLEGIGAAVEAPAPGSAFFSADGLLRLHRDGLPGVIDAARRACTVEMPTLPAPRIGAASTRFCALAAARAMAPPGGSRQAGRAGGSRPSPRRRATVVEGRSAVRWLAAQPVGLLGLRAQTAELAGPLMRLGIGTLGQVRELGADAMADRFGQPGALAHRLACGWDEPLRPRPAPERLREEIELRQADSGPALARALEVLIDRLLARRERQGRTLRAVTLSARLVEGGTWRRRVVFRQASAEALRIGLALTPHLSGLPAPAESLRLEVESFGSMRGEQQTLLDGERELRRARLREAVGQVRAAAGAQAALRIVLVEAGSRAPERRAVLAPFQG